MTATTPLARDPVLDLFETDTERYRYDQGLQIIGQWAHLIRGKRVLDFGSSWGTSMLIAHQLGASSVVGVEPDGERVQKAAAILQAATGADLQILHVPDTRKLPFADGEFPVVLVNAVVEHIPQPRDAWLREMWRVLASGGYILIQETPNKYVPFEAHTTKLWFNHWLPKQMAYRRAVRNYVPDPSRPVHGQMNTALRGFRPDRDPAEWDGSGWRGAGYFELVKHFPGYRLIPETSRLRHRVLTFFGIPASIADPSPFFVFQKR